MGGTGGDNSASDDVWWFLSPELSRLASIEVEFIMQWTRHERVAQEILWEGADDRSIRWYAEIETRGQAVVCDGLLLVPSSTAINRGLWHPKYFRMDWAASEGLYVGPVMRLERWQNPADAEHSWDHLVYDRRTTVHIAARLMRFHHGDVVRNLRQRGLMPWPAPGPTQTPIQVPVSGVQGGGVVGSVRVITLPGIWDPQSDWSVEAVMLNLELAGRRQKKAMKTIIEACSQLSKRPKYRGKGLPEILDKISAAELQRAVASASPDSCERFLTAWKAWRAKHH